MQIHITEVNTGHTITYVTRIKAVFATLYVHEQDPCFEKERVLENESHLWACSISGSNTLTPWRRGGQWGDTHGTPKENGVGKRREAEMAGGRRWCRDTPEVPRGTPSKYPKSLLQPWAPVARGQRCVPLLTASCSSSSCHETLRKPSTLRSLKVTVFAFSFRRGRRERRRRGPGFQGRTREGSFPRSSRGGDSNGGHGRRKARQHRSWRRTPSTSAPPPPPAPPAREDHCLMALRSSPKDQRAYTWHRLVALSPC